MIRISNLTKRYPRALRPALDDISLHVPKGSIFGLLGANGAGKTTLLSLLAGLLEPDAGSVTVDGVDPARNPGIIRSLLGFVPQDLAFYPMLSVWENLAFYAGVQGLHGAEKRDRIEEVIAAVRLEAFGRQGAELLSGGLKRRLNLAIGLLGKPRLLCLDEPTVGIDPHSRQFILERIRAIRDEGVTVIYTSHYMDEVQRLCDSVAIIDEGRILVASGMEELLSGHAGELLRVRLAGGGAGACDAVAAEVAGTRRVGAAMLEVETSDPLAALAQLGREAAAAGQRIAGIEYGRRSLEELYLSLSGKPWEEDNAPASDER